MINKITKFSALVLVGIMSVLIGIDSTYAENEASFSEQSGVDSTLENIVSFCSDEGELFTVKQDGINIDTFIDASSGRDTAVARSIVEHYRKNSSNTGWKEIGPYKYVNSSESVLNVGGDKAKCVKFFKTDSEGSHTYQRDCTPVGDNISSTVNWEFDPNSHLGKVTISLQETNGNYLNTYFNKDNFDFVVTIGSKDYSGNVSVSGKNVIISNITPPAYNAGNNSTVLTFKMYTKNGNSDAATYGVRNKGFALTEIVKTNGRSTYADYCANENGKVFVYYTTNSTAVKYNTEVMVNNSYRNSTICQNVQNYPHATNEQKNKIVPECYKEQYSLYEFEQIGVVDPQTNKNRLQEEYEFLLWMFEGSYTTHGLTEVAKDAKLICTDPRLGIPSDEKDDLHMPFEYKTTYVYTGEYWNMSCKEEYYIKSSDPKFVFAGQGVEYPNKLEIKRTCRIIETRQAEKPPVCQPSCSVTCTYGNGTDVRANQTGPNDDLDQCVYNCDGGKYTQSCINKCYNDVYKEERKLSLKNDLFSTKNKIERETKFADETDPNTLNITNMILNKELVLDKEHGCYNKVYCATVDFPGCGPVQIGVSQWCANEDDGKHKGETALDYGGSRCTSHPNPCPEGSVGSPEEAEAVYQQRLNEKKAEYNSLVEYSKTVNEVENYTIEFKDSESVPDTIYSISGGTSVDQSTPHLYIKNEKAGFGCSSQKESPQVGNFCNAIDADILLDIDLPLAYSLKNDPETIVVSAEDKDGNPSGYYVYKNNTVKDKNGNLKYVFKSTKFDKTLATEGQRVFYTQLHGSDTNVDTYIDCVGGNCDKETTFKCDATLQELIATATYHNEEATGATELKKIYDKNGELVKDLGYETIFDGRAYVYFNMNNQDIAKLLTDTDKNIKVSFKIKSIGESITNENIKSKSDITKFEASGYDCYYGVTNMLTTTIKDGNNDKKEVFISETSCENPNDKSIGNGGNNGGYGAKYYYHEIDLNDVFAESENARRIPRWNWSAAAIDYTDSNYVIDPIKLTEAIEAKGENVWNDEGEVDYEFTMTRKLINEIRKYNDTKVKGKKVPYTTFKLAGTKDRNYSELISEWYSDTSLPTTAYQITNCNNALNRASCVNYK